MAGLLHRSMLILVISTLSFIGSVANAQSNSNTGGDANAGRENTRTMDSRTDRVSDWGWLGLAGLVGLLGLIPRKTETTHQPYATHSTPSPAR